MDDFGRSLTKQEIGDLIEGATLLGSGGGGDPGVARDNAEYLLTRGKRLRLVDVDDVSDDAWVCILGYVGGGVDEKDMMLVQDLERIWDKPIILAALELSKFLKVDFEAYLPSEIGAGNIMANFLVASEEDKPVIDADCAGARAKPELTISLTNLEDIPVYPFCGVTHYGDVALINRIVSDRRAEQLCRSIARISGGRLGVARCPTALSTIKKAVCRRSISLALNIGKTVRERGAKSIDYIKESVRGKVLFEGEISQVKREYREGFVWGEIEIEGINNDRTHTYRIWFKNENLLGWKDGFLDICCPDQIIMLERETGKGVYNWGGQLREGLMVSILGAMASAAWRSEKGLRLFGPKHFGFDVEYKALRLQDDGYEIPGE